MKILAINDHLSFDLELSVLNKIRYRESNILMLLCNNSLNLSVFNNDPHQY